MTYNDSHRYFVQYLMEKGCVALNKAEDYYQNVCARNDTGTSTSLTCVIEAINKRIASQSFRVEKTRCEVTDVELLVFVNMVHDEASERQTFRTPNESEYFHLLINEILTSDAKRLSHIYCLSMASVAATSSPLIRHFTPRKAEEFLEFCERSGYLVIEGGFVYFGARTIREYGTFFRVGCHDHVELCNLCSELVFHGTTCSKCDTLMHKFCLNTYFSRQIKCPSCGENWSEKDLHQTDSD